MSQKVHVKSLRAPVWGSAQGAWYTEKNYGAYMQKNLMSMKLLHQIFGKSLSVKVTKAPAKRRLHKPYYLLSSVCSKFVGSLFICNPLLSSFPKKGLAAKYGPYHIQKPKKFQKF
jgi:hypothetical protein